MSFFPHSVTSDNNIGSHIWNPLNCYQLQQTAHRQTLQLTEIRNPLTKVAVHVFRIILQLSWRRQAAAYHERVQCKSTLYVVISRQFSKFDIKCGHMTYRYAALQSCFPGSFDSTFDVSDINLNNFEKKFIKKYLFFMKIDLCQCIFFQIFVGLHWFTLILLWIYYTNRSL